MIRLILISSVLLSAGIQTAWAQGLVVLVGEAQLPPDMIPLSAAKLSTQLQWQESGAEGRAPQSAQLTTLFLKGEKLFWKQGRINAAIQALEQARKLLTSRVEKAQRPAILKGLWLLAQLYLHKKRPSDAKMVIIDALRTDTSTTPDVGTASPTLLSTYQRLHKNFVEAGAYLTLMSNAKGDCRVHVDGVVEGSPGERLGPFEAGEYDFFLTCHGQRTPSHKASLNQGDTRLTIPSWELGVSVAGSVLRTTDESSQGELTRQLFTRTQTPWVLFVSSAGEGRLKPTLRLRNHEKAKVGEALQLSELHRWVKENSQFEVTVSSSGAESRPASRLQWYQLTTVVAGVALLAVGAYVHGEALDAWSQTNDGTVDRRDEFSSMETTYLSLYVVGSAIVVGGLSWAIYDKFYRSDTALIPGPGTLYFVHRF
ncbi:MAG TPA: hypothetical protein EYN06_09790 [Myxococcales bacterium]|nr:hypothetical protein [Myxococcales bacterium]HIN86760.1 hypothetical protein [Myxococcales bacterium]